MTQLMNADDARKLQNIVETHKDPEIVRMARYVMENANSNKLSSKTRKAFREFIDFLDSKTA